MCFASSPDIPDPEKPEPPPKPADSEVQQARERSRRKSLAARGRSSTILTGPQGVTSQANTQRKTLLGQ